MEIATSSGRIAIYDNCLKRADAERVFEFVANSLFKIGWNDNHANSGLANSYMHSGYSDDDLHRSGFLPALLASSAASELDGYYIRKAVVNLSTPADTHFIHTHGSDDKIVLYYVNLYWNENWYGETLFYNDDCTRIELAAPYTPGRVIVFDPKIPHTIRPQSHAADKFRFTLALVLRLHDRQT